jgi:homocysteine S-methyltransferase
MTRYRKSLPQLGGGLFLTDGGLETTLVFHQGIDLPCFAAIELLKRDDGEAILRRYFDTYADIARRFRAGMVLESPTWRANPDWGRELGYGEEELAAANRRSIAFLETLRDAYEADDRPVVISGCIGPRGDGYVVDRAMSWEEAEAYHRSQVETFASTAADMLSAMTINYVEEAVGIVKAAKAAGMPISLSFTVETDGRLPTGQALGEAIEQVDAETAAHPAYYMINCAHPSHFDTSLVAGEGWLERIGGVRANASRMSHEELDEAPELDEGDPVEFGREYAELKKRLRNLTVLGGCCGTDHRHVEQVASACAPLFREAS